MATQHLSDTEFLQVYRIVSKIEQPVSSFYDPATLKERYNITTDDIYHIRKGEYRKYLLGEGGPVDRYTAFMDTVDYYMEKMQNLLAELHDWVSEERNEGSSL